MSLGESPDGWSTVPLGSCVEILDARREPVSSKERAKRLGDIPYYGATGQVGWIDEYLFDEELLLVGEDGAPFFDKTKPIAYVIDGKSWVNNHAHVLRARQGVVSNKYLKYFLDSFDFTDYVGGSTRDKLTQGSMKSIPVPLAPPSVQEEMVRILDQCAELTDQAKTHLSRARDAGERFRQGVLAAACSGRLTEDWRESHPEAPSVEARLAELESAGRTMRKKVSDPPSLQLPDFPDSYLVATVGVAATAIDYGTSQKASPDPHGVPVLRMGNIQGGDLVLTDLKYVPLDSKTKKLMLAEGDLLFNRTNSPELVGKSAVFHGREAMTFASYLIRVRLDSDVVEPDFVLYWLNSAWGRLWARHVKTDGVSQSNINGSKLASMPLPLPPIDEQREIVSRATAMMEKADVLLNGIRGAGGALVRSEDAVRAKAFRGELTEDGSLDTALPSPDAIAGNRNISRRE